MFYKIVISSLFFSLCFCLLANAQPFPVNQDEFPGQLKARLDKYNLPAAQAFVKQFLLDWEAGILTPQDKDTAIVKINHYMKDKGWRLYPNVAQYLSTLVTIRRPESKVRIKSRNFFMITDSCVKQFTLEETHNYLRWLEKFCPQAKVVETSNFNWRITQSEPTLVFRSDYDPKLDLMVTFPALLFSSTDIIYSSKFDSTAIQKTSGYLNLVNRKFYGTGGRYDWSRVGLPLDEVYCELDKYVADLSLIDFVADSVKFYYRGLLNKPMKGRLQEHLTYEKDYEKAQYPYFRSDEGDVRIDNFVPNVTYEGGFSLRGVTKIGSRTPTSLATLTIKNTKGERVLKTTSDEVLLNPKKMTTQRAGITLYMPEGDSMTHPSMNLYYNVETQDMTLSINRKEKESRQPILNSYLKYALYFDAIKYNPNRDTVSFTATVDKEHKLFAVESYDFFRRSRFWQYKGVLSFHPLGIIYRYYLDNIRKNQKLVAREEKRKKRKTEETRSDYDFSDEFENYFEKRPENEPEPEPQSTPEATETTDLGETKREFTIAEILKKYGLMAEKQQFILALDDLIGAGFIDFNPELEIITIHPSLFRWAKAAANAKDYDAISIVSQVSGGNNGELYYSKGFMELKGVPVYSLSDSQHIQFKTQDEKIFLLKNRDIHCGGWLEAGKINLYGKGYDRFKFSYDDFRINCDSIDVLTFAPQRDPNFKAEKFKGKKATLMDGLKRLKIEKLRGAVYVNKFNNKSSRKPLHEYSLFDCYTESYVFWSDSTIQNGVYDRKKLFYVVDPFVIDSLERFNIENLQFVGELNCGEIMPAFRDTLKPVADNTYGVVEILPEEGVELYNGKGRFYNQIQLDGFGLHGNGQLDFLSTVAKSDTFIFHFDSVMAVTSSFYLPEGEYEGVHFPEIKVEKAKYKWYPKRERLVIETMRGAMGMFQGVADFRGRIVITPNGVKGEGTVIMGQEQFESKDITFEQNKFTMENGTYYVTDPEIPTKHQFVAKHVAAEHDLETQKTNFVSTESGKHNMFFAQQKYSTSLTRGEYDKQTKEIKLSKRPLDTKSAGFISTDSAQHRLRFSAKAAECKLGEEEIYVTGADSIFVADAIVFPDSAKVTIRPSGRVKELERAKIVCDTATRMHQMIDAQVQIISGIDYRASATYKYRFKGKEQLIKFDEVIVRPDTVTFGRAVIPEDQQFLITERFYFKDTVELVGKRKYMNFSGFVKIESSNPALKDEWFPINEKDVNPDAVVLRISRERLGGLTAGLHFLHERTAFYSKFLEKKTDRHDVDVLVADGAITFDPFTKEFRIGPLEKLKGNMYKGNVVSYQDSLDIITSRGFFNFPYHHNKEIDFFPMEMAGSWRHDREHLRIQSDLLLNIKFPPALKIPLDNFANKCKEFSFSEGDLTELGTDRVLHESIAEFIDKNDSNEVKTRALVSMVSQEDFSFANVNIAKDIPGNLTLSNISFYYCDSLGTNYLYCDKMIGLIGINGKSLNKKVKAKILYTIGIRNPNGTYQPDKCQIYLEINEYEWIYFEFKDNIMKTTSTNNKYVMDINVEAAKLAKKNKELDKNEFGLSVATEDEVSRYIGEFGAAFTLSPCGK